MAGHWPSDMIDGEQLFELMGLSSADPDDIGQEAYDRLLDFETAVDDAYAHGKIKRFTAKDPGTGEVVAHGYQRAAAKAILSRLAVPSGTPSQPKTTI